MVGPVEPENVVNFMKLVKVRVQVAKTAEPCLHKAIDGLLSGVRTADYRL